MGLVENPPGSAQGANQLAGNSENRPRQRWRISKRAVAENQPCLARKIRAEMAGFWAVAEVWSLSPVPSGVVDWDSSNAGNRK
jgi:hypothetical protein